MTIQRGDLIKVKAYGGKELSVYCVDVQGQKVIVTTEEERHKAATEQREPICLGFPLVDVISIERRLQAKS